MSEVRCPAKNFKLEYAGATRARWCATIPADHTIEDVLHPNYFGRIANTNKEKLKIRDIIEVEWEDNTKFGELQIRVVEGVLEQVVTAIRRDIMEIGSPDLPPGWSMEFQGPQYGWALINNGTLKERGFMSQEAAAMRAAFFARVEVQASVARPALKATPAKRAKAEKPAETPADA